MEEKIQRERVTKVKQVEWPKNERTMVEERKMKRIKKRRERSMVDEQRGRERKKE